MALPFFLWLGVLIYFAASSDSLVQKGCGDEIR